MAVTIKLSRQDADRLRKMLAKTAQVIEVEAPDANIASLQITMGGAVLRQFGGNLFTRKQDADFLRGVANLIEFGGRIESERN